MNIFTQFDARLIIRNSLSIHMLARVFPVLILLISVLASLSNDSYVGFIKDKYFDSLQRLMPRPVDPGSTVVILDIDERSLEVFGQWPWPRTELGRIVDRVRESGASVLGIDVLFPESDRLNPSQFSKLFPRLSEEAKNEINNIPGNDKVFGAALSKYAVVLGRSGENSIDGFNGTVPVKRVLIRTEKGAPDPVEFLPRFSAIISNIEELETSADHIYGGFGLLNVFPDRDGVVRKIPSVIKIDGCIDRPLNKGCSFLHPSFFLETIRVNEYRTSKNRQPSQRILISGGYAGIKNIKVSPSRVLGVDISGYVRPWFSKSDASKYISVSEIFDPEFDKARLSEKIVLIGTSAVGLKDIKIVPTTNNMPGVEVHAQAIEAVLGDFVLERPGEFLTYELAVLILIGIFMILAFPYLGAVWTFVGFLALNLVVFGFSYFLFVDHKMLFDASVVFVVLVTIFFVQTIFRFVFEERSRRQTRSAFSKYLSPDMVDIVSEDPSKLALGGEEREITLLFCDVRGFTGISEIYDAVGLTKLINRLLTPLTGVILNNGGTVDKYMGDCIMAFWNAPLSDAKHAYHACVSALEMLGEVEKLNHVLKAEALLEKREHRELRLGFGVNTGMCVVGNMGSEQRFDYSCLGDSVNLAARIEGQSKDYGCKIVLSEFTQVMVPSLATLEIDLIKVKGKSEAVRIYALCGDEGVREEMAFKEFEREHNSILVEYREQNWDRCIEMCEKAKNQNKDWFGLVEGFYDVLIARCSDFKVNSPELVNGKWDGVFVATTK